MKVRLISGFAITACVTAFAALLLAATPPPGPTTSPAASPTSTPMPTAALRCYNKTSNGTACITIDDGYGYKNQKRILDTLRKHGVKCTFFVVGEALLRKPNYWEQAIQDGHEICYHSMRHKNLTKMTDEQIQKDIDDWNAALEKALPGYKSPKLARFPGDNGEKDKRVLAVFAKNGYTVISWNVHDISNDPKRNASFIRGAMKENSILLIHFKPVDAEGLPRYIGNLKERFKLGLVSDAFPESKPTAEPTATAAPLPGYWQEYYYYGWPWYEPMGMPMGMPTATNLQ